MESESEVAQSSPTLCDPMDCSLPGFSVHGIFQARVLEWVAISFSRGSFLTQGLNPGLLHCRQMLYPLSHQGIISILSSILNTNVNIIFWEKKVTQWLWFFKITMETWIYKFQIMSRHIGVKIKEIKLVLNSQPLQGYWKYAVFLWWYFDNA